MIVTLTEQEKVGIIEAAQDRRVERVTFHRNIRVFGREFDPFGPVYEARIRRDYKGRPSIYSVKAY